jgi:hypothetical protein
MMLINSSGSHLNYCDIVVSGESHLPYKPVPIKKVQENPLMVKIKIPLLRISDFRNKIYPPKKAKLKENIPKRTVFHMTTHTPKTITKVERNIGLVLNKISGSIVSKSPSPIRYVMKEINTGRSQLSPSIIHRRAYTNKCSEQFAATGQAFMTKNDKLTERNIDLKSTFTVIKQKIAHEMQTKQEDLRPWTRSSNNSVK